MQSLQRIETLGPKTDFVSQEWQNFFLKQACL